MKFILRKILMMDFKSFLKQIKEVYMAATENRWNPTEEQRKKFIPIIKEYLEKVK